MSLIPSTSANRLVQALLRLIESAIMDDVPAFELATVTAIELDGRVQIKRLGSTTPDDQYHPVLGSPQLAVNDTVICARYSKRLVILGLVNNPPTKRRAFGVENASNGANISHGLPGLPTAVIVTPGVAQRIACVTARSTTDFTISLHNDAGTAINSPEQVFWVAEL